MRTIYLLLGLVVLLAVGLVLESVTGSPVVAALCVLLLFAALIVRYEVFGRPD